MSNVTFLTDTGGGGGGSGLPGRDGKSPYIGTNGNWFSWNDATLSFFDTGVQAQGEDGTADLLNYYTKSEIDEIINNAASEPYILPAASETTLGGVKIGAGISLSENGTISVVNDIDETDIPTKTSELENDSGYIIAEDIPSIPSKVGELENDIGYITADDIPTNFTEGFSPQITVTKNTDTEYILTITTKDGTFDTPNLLLHMNKVREKVAEAIQHADIINREVVV